MKRAWLLLTVLWSSLAGAAVINVEFKFTPFVGDPANADQVDTVPGTARVFINNVPIAEQPVQKDSLPVMFEAREVAPAVWVPIASSGPSVRQGDNTIRIEFEPADPQLAYRAQLRWATVNDEATSDTTPTGGSATNQSDEGVLDQPGKGRLVLERAFRADFAADQPWHHYAPVTALDAADRQRLLELVSARAALFKPGFDAVYAILAQNPQIPLARVKELKCLDKVHKAGLRLSAPTAEQLDIALTGQPEVVLSRKDGGQLFQPADATVMDAITDADVQMCAGAALFAVFPPRLVVVRGADGAWSVAY